MATNQYAIERRDQIRLDKIGPLIERELVGGERMFWAITAGAAMRNHQRKRTQRTVGAHTSNQTTVATIQLSSLAHSLTADPIRLRSQPASRIEK